MFPQKGFSHLAITLLQGIKRNIDRLYFMVYICVSLVRIQLICVSDTIISVVLFHVFSSWNINGSL